MEEEVYVDDYGVGWRKSLRVKIVINITKPITRGRTIIVNGDCVWVPLKYEKLYHVCFECGRIEHIGKVCSRATKQTVGIEQFGS